MNRPLEKLKKQVSDFPSSPGIYQFLDKYLNIIYIGKAKNIKHRVQSYFKKNIVSAKTKLLVLRIFDIKYFLVDTELDALLLENNLIKKYQPKYNILLKDDKTYPFICIKNEPFPRVFQTRKVLNDGSDFYGPYVSSKVVRTLVDFFHKLYPLRTCNFKLDHLSINEKSYKSCLEYHIGNCLAPCELRQMEKDYEHGIKHIRKILKGDISSVIDNLKTEMIISSKKLDFEKARIIKNQLILLENYQSKSVIVNPKITNVDVFSIVSDEKHAFINYLKINSGAIIQTHTVKISKKLDENDDYILSHVITQLRIRYNSTAMEIYTPIQLTSLWENVKVTVPKKGDKYKLIELSKRNAFQIQFIEKNKAYKSKKSYKNSILKSLKIDLHLESLPNHIECFDNSNIQGHQAVSACVVFRNSKPSKKEYRHFNIKSVDGPDDFLSMKEVVFRRYRGMLKRGDSLPELIIIDGGKGQLSSAVSALEELDILQKIKIISIAKKLEEIFIHGESLPLYLDKRSPSLKLIQNLRNEAHRFSLKHHRNQRSKDMFATSLDNIPGIGDKTISILFSHFGTIEKIKSSKKEDLIKLIGNFKANKISDIFAKK
ncbi:MAG: excinuclease ABC subunit C [Flavobacteriales bacterium]|nr:excinuclease ABC subunit C [Flavobacteriales bacterium]